jgi:hypothetical protein
MARPPMATAAQRCGLMRAVFDEHDGCLASDSNNRGDQGQRSTSDEGGALGEDQLAQQLSEVARHLQQEDTL